LSAEHPRSLDFGFTCVLHSALQSQLGARLTSSMSPLVPRPIEAPLKNMNGRSSRNVRESSSRATSWRFCYAGCSLSASTPTEAFKCVFRDFLSASSTCSFLPNGTRIADFHGALWGGRGMMLISAPRLELDDWMPLSRCLQLGVCCRDLLSTKSRSTSSPPVFSTTPHRRSEPVLEAPLSQRLEIGQGRFTLRHLYRRLATTQSDSLTNSSVSKRAPFTRTDCELGARCRAKPVGGMPHTSLQREIRGARKCITERSVREHVDDFAASLA
jgi:hypothetical protein